MCIREWELYTKDSAYKETNSLPLCLTSCIGKRGQAPYMILIRRIFDIIVRNAIGLAVMIVFVILIAFLPTAFSVHVPNTGPAVKGPRLQAVQLDKEWTISSQSAAYMTVKTSGEQVNYKFSDLQGYWDFDLQAPEQMRAAATIKTASVDSGNLLRDHFVRGEEVLNVEQYPDATFELTSVGSWPSTWEMKKEQRFIIKGRLTLKGVTQPVEMDTAAKYVDGKLLVKANSKIHLPDFQVQNLQGNLFKTEEEGEINLQLILEDRGGLSPDQKSKSEDLAALATPRPKQDVSTTYQANVKIDPASHTVTGQVEITTSNDTQAVQDAVYFHLYPNQFEHAEDLTSTNWDQVIGTEYRLPGWIDVRRVEVDGQEVSARIKKTLLEVPLPHWQPHQQAQIKLDFQLTVPRNQGRIAYNEHEMWLGNWLPIRAVFEQSAWRLDPYYPIGDPFYSETANYEVQVTLPKPYRLASTGTDLQIAEDDQFRHYSISAPQVREFAAVALDDNYVSAEQRVGDVLVKTWYRKLDNPFAVQQLHDVGVQAIDFFSKHYGAYPFPEYEIVSTGFLTGMEYPGLVFVNGDYFTTTDPKGVFAVLHETGHQWWYSAVGSDQIRESWLDEGLNDYTNMRYFLEFDPMKAHDMIQKREANLQAIQELERQGETMANSLDMFSSWSAYGKLAYQKGSLLFYRLDQAVGQETMDRILQKYYAKYRFQNAHGEDLIQLFEQELGPEVRAYFNTWLHGGTAEFARKQGGESL